MTDTPPPTERRTRPMTRRALLLGTGAAAGYAAAWALTPDRPTLAGTAQLPNAGPASLDDASGLMATRVEAHQVYDGLPPRALRDAYTLELGRAGDRPVMVSAARHTMGGHALPPGGRAITVSGGAIEVDTGARLFRAPGGARWAGVIGQLDPLGFGPAVMQSNHDFGVAATFSVDAHGWAAPRGPMSSTVREIEMMLPNGDMVTCSRDQEPELFSAAAGGYGLIGLITSITCEMVPNQRLVPSFRRMPAHDLGTAFSAAMREPSNVMAYARLSVDREMFFDEALLITYAPDVDQRNLEPASGSGMTARAAARLYRWQIGHEGWKRRRWELEAGLMPRIGTGAVTRNSLINEPVATLDDGDPDRTDILHEYFVAPERFPEFLEICRRIIPGSYQELINITLRWVAADDTAMLGYAHADRIAGVMSFSQERTTRADADMKRMTEELIEAVLGIGGTYYLPYRPHATPEQFVRAYPSAENFAQLKRRLDPDLRLRSVFWDRYLEPL